VRLIVEGIEVDDLMVEVMVVDIENISRIRAPLYMPSAACTFVCGLRVFRVWTLDWKP
jgi:hypothetical protein